MLEGITVLSQQMLWTCNSWLGVIFIISIIGFMFGCWILIEEGYNYNFLILLLMCIFGFIFSLTSHAGETQYTQYKVTISEDVKMAEFMSKYQIISQEGKIYTITEREKVAEMEGDK